MVRSGPALGTLTNKLLEWQLGRPGATEKQVDLHLDALLRLFLLVGFETDGVVSLVSPAGDRLPAAAAGGVDGREAQREEAGVNRHLPVIVIADGTRHNAAGWVDDLHICMLCRSGACCGSSTTMSKGVGKTARSTDFLTSLATAPQS